MSLSFVENQESTKIVYKQDGESFEYTVHLQDEIIQKLCGGDLSIFPSIFQNYIIFEMDDYIEISARNISYRLYKNGIIPTPRVLDVDKESYIDNRVILDLLESKFNKLEKKLSSYLELQVKTNKETLENDKLKVENNKKSMGFLSSCLQKIEQVQRVSENEIDLIKNNQLMMLDKMEQAKQFNKNEIELIKYNQTTMLDKIEKLFQHYSTKINDLDKKISSYIKEDIKKKQQNLEFSQKLDEILSNQAKILKDSKELDELKELKENFGKLSERIALMEAPSKKLDKLEDIVIEIDAKVGFVKKECENIIATLPLQNPSTISNCLIDNLSEECKVNVYSAFSFKLLRKSYQGPIFEIFFENPSCIIPVFCDENGKYYWNSGFKNEWKDEDYLKDWRVTGWFDQMNHTWEYKIGGPNMEKGLVVIKDRHNYENLPIFNPKKRCIIFTNNTCFDGTAFYFKRFQKSTQNQTIIFHHGNLKIDDKDIPIFNKGFPLISLGDFKLRTKGIQYMNIEGDHHYLFGYVTPNNVITIEKRQTNDKVETLCHLSNKNPDFLVERFECKKSSSIRKEYSSLGNFNGEVSDILFFEDGISIKDRLFINTTLKKN